MTVVLSSLAVADLRAIGRFIARDNPARAVSFVRQLRDAALQLADLLRGFPLVPRYEQEGIRRRSWHGYGILHSAEDERVFVHHIIGPGRDHERVLRLR